jgi:SAM-dependent methyltransferase
LSDQTTPDAAQDRRAYWERRADSLYLQYVFFLARVVGRDAGSVIDVGSNGCPYIEWLDWIPRKLSVDLEMPYSSATVEGRTGDFLALDIGESFDLGLCLQVLEHVPEVAAFARKLLATTPHLIVSVPYRWEPGQTEHVHDPVDEEKLAGWFGRAPNYRVIVREPFFRKKRLIAYFDREDPSRRIAKAEVHQRRPSPLIPPWPA